MSDYDGQDQAYQDLLEENDEHADMVYRLCGIIDCYLMGSESLEKIDSSARKLLDEVGFEWR